MIFRTTAVPGVLRVEQERNEDQRGVRFDDPAFAIPWPLRDSILLERDRAYADFAAETVR